MKADEIFDSVETQPWINTTSAKLQRAVHGLLTGAKGKKVEKMLNGSWLGSPLHPIMTDIAIGGYTVGWVLDIIAEVKDDDRLRKSADDAIAVGLVGAIGTVATGLTDWTYARGRARPLGFIHAIINSAGTALYLAAFLTRKRNRPLRFWLAMAGATVVTVGSYLGGKLVYDEGMGVKPPQKRRPLRTAKKSVTA